MEFEEIIYFLKLLKGAITGKRDQQKHNFPLWFMKLAAKYFVKLITAQSDASDAWSVSCSKWFEIGSL